MTKSELIRIAIKNCNDAEELKRLEAELVRAVEEEALAKARAEVAKEADDAQKAADDAAKKAADEAAKKGVKDGQQVSKLAQIPDGTKITQGTPGEYMGVNLKRAIDSLQRDGRVSAKVRAKSLKSPDDAETVCKWMIGVMSKARVGSSIKSMTEGTDSAGGYLTPTEERMAVLSYVRDTSIALADCAHLPMTSDSMTIPRELGKVSVAYTGEATDATATSATLAEVTLTAKRMDAYTDVSNELLDDAGTPGGIAGLLAGQFLEAVGQKVDSTVFLGTGDPVSGIFLSAGYSEVFASGSTHFSEVLDSNIRNIIAKIRPNRRANAKWYGATSVLWAYVRGLTDSNGKPLYYDPTGGGPVPGMLYGYPYREGNDDIMKSTSAAATAMLVFGDLAGFIIGDRMTNVQLMENPYLLMTKNMTRFHLFTRWAYAQGLPESYARMVTAGS